MTDPGMSFRSNHGIEEERSYDEKMQSPVVSDRSIREMGNQQLEDDPSNTLMTDPGMSFRSNHGIEEERSYDEKMQSPVVSDRSIREMGNQQLGGDPLNTFSSMDLLGQEDALDPRGKDYYELAMKGEWEKMKEMYEREAEKDLFLTQLRVTILGDTIFHSLAHSRRPDLMESLISHFPAVAGLTNWRGNSVLYEVATSGDVEMAKLVLDEHPQMLEDRNFLGETPLFRAAAYGNTEMVSFLAKRLNEYDPTRSGQLRRWDGTPILHIALRGRYFETALKLLELCEERKHSLAKDLACMADAQGKLALHLLANTPTAFKSGCRMGIISRLIYSFIPDPPAQTKEQGREGDIETGFCPRNYQMPMIILYKLQIVLGRVCNYLCQACPELGKLREQKKEHQLALELVKKLVSIDHSWLWDSTIGGENTAVAGGRPENHTEIIDASSDSTSSASASSPADRFSAFSPADTSSSSSAANGAWHVETPLLKAAEHGITEIVEEILNEFPQAAEHVNSEAKNILHVVAEFRQEKIFKFLSNRPSFPLRRLHRWVDAKRNTVLHNAANYVEEKKGIYQGGTHRPGEALHLQFEIQWFKQIQEIVPASYLNSMNEDEETPLTLFSKTHENLVKEGKKWLVRTGNSCTLVAVLIATVAFTSAYTIPGGPDNEGRPLLVKENAFIIFTVADTLSLSFSLTSVVVFLSIMTATFRQQDFHHSLPLRLIIGLSALFLSVTTMMVAFAATMVLMFRRRLHDAAIPIYLLAFLPVSIFVPLQFPLYVRLGWYSLRDFWKAFRATFLGAPTPQRF